MVKEKGLCMGTDDKTGKIISFPGNTSGDANDLSVDQLKALFLSRNQQTISSTLRVMLGVSASDAESLAEHFCQIGTEIDENELNKVLGRSHCGFNDRMELLHKYLGIQGLAAMFFIDKVSSLASKS